jgi:amino-acid N-acetyltransferase
MIATVTRAKLSHAKKIHELINAEASKEMMLPRPLGSIYEFIRDFVIAKDETGKIVGCCALHVSWENLAEVRSLAVAETMKGKGLGLELVARCIAEGYDLGIKRIFALTYITSFFHKCGFHDISKDDLPHKIWNDCINCHKFPECDEKAVAIDLTE